jgi:hypothetical protein
MEIELARQIACVTRDMRFARVICTNNLTSVDKSSATH